MVDELLWGVQLNLPSAPLNFLLFFFSSGVSRRWDEVLQLVISSFVPPPPEQYPGNQLNHEPGFYGSWLMSCFWGFNSTSHRRHLTVCYFSSPQESPVGGARFGSFQFVLATSSSRQAPFSTMIPLSTSSRLPPLKTIPLTLLLTPPTLPFPLFFPLHLLSSSLHLPPSPLCPPPPLRLHPVPYRRPS